QMQRQIDELQQENARLRQQLDQLRSERAGESNSPARSGIDGQEQSTNPTPPARPAERDVTTP
ncbi:MAG: hypothetical protein KF861_13860, partial [Planctomycetaceae bacterium]|nr:hypothetical protein [Planctomycetaceae bacterium]